jgi:hypothetical protein
MKNNRTFIENVKVCNQIYLFVYLLDVCPCISFPDLLAAILDSLLNRGSVVPHSQGIDKWLSSSFIIGVSKLYSCLFHPKVTSYVQMMENLISR